jgi:hypothetical protein
VKGPRSKQDLNFPFLLRDYAKRSNFSPSRPFYNFAQKVEGDQRDSISKLSLSAEKNGKERKSIMDRNRRDIKKEM